MDRLTRWLFTRPLARRTPAEPIRTRRRSEKLAVTPLEDRLVPATLVYSNDLEPG